MAKKSKDIKPGYGKLLDAWSPPRNAGHPVGCVATSFTFSTAFFEEECLARFLGVESDPLEDGPAYIIEREVKMAQIICACAIVDQHHCKGLRSLRWDLLPARVSRGILHAKVSLLVWTDAVRLIVGSANLTEDGYRRNLEIFATFDYTQDGECPIELLRGYTQFLRECANYSQRDDQYPSAALLRLRALLDRADQTPTTWGLLDDDARRTGLSAYPVTVRPGGAHAFSSLNSIWPATSPASDAYVVSPFFDPPEIPNAPAKELWQSLRKRGDAHVHLCLDAEDTPDGDVLVHAPRSLLDAQPAGRPGIETNVCRICQDATRPLHAKAISLEDDRWRLYMVGSSNFTSAGLGLPTPRNLEANVAFLVDSSKVPDAAKALDLAFPENEQLPPDKVRWQGGFESEDEMPNDEPILPDTFGSATLTADGADKLFITFCFAGAPPDGWRIVLEDESAEILSEDTWKAAGAPETHTVPWELPRPPSGFWVSWRDGDGRAWWPVNVESARALPPPDELRALPLDVLINILTSARPLVEIIRGGPNGKKTKDLLPTPEISMDPHRRVDTSRFLLQRTRRVSWALTALRKRLEVPVATESSLVWRLYGPVGVQALIEALIREAHSDDERAFLLCELALELWRVKPTTQPGYLPSARVRDEIRKIMAGIQKCALENLNGSANNLRAYIEQVFEVVKK